jgi:phosphoribosylformylglycinamidine synthase
VSHGTLPIENSQVSNSSKRNKPALIWQVEIRPAVGQPDRLGSCKLANAMDLQLPEQLKISAARGYLLQGSLERVAVEGLAAKLLAEPVVETFRVGVVGEAWPEQEGEDEPNLFRVFVLPLPGVTDPEAESALMAMRDLGYQVEAVRTFRKYCVSQLPPLAFERLKSKVLSNASIEMTMVGRLELDDLKLGRPYEFRRRDVPLDGLSDEGMLAVSRDWQLSLSLPEMQTIREHYRQLKRPPSDIELETIAQTWSEHCSHKTLAGRINYQDPQGTRSFQNMLKETIFAATMKVRADRGKDDWCVSVFADNAGVVRFDDHFNVVIKVETHNRPSALEPYGGANTGLGGVIRDTLGTGLGAKPICSTNVFCFAPPTTPNDQLPPGVMHPRMIMQGVVSGVRDYGNRMGIPTVNGAVYFDARYVGNPLVFCGNVGLIPRDKSFKEPQPNDLIVSIGGKTGRDGIHGATFSSAELTESSDISSGGAVQIGNAITERMLMDVMLKARDLNLYNAVTDCGAGGYSSAVGEMGEKIGAEVWLDQVPLKYQGLSYTEIWISEAQERMVLSVPESKWEVFRDLCAAESVVATVIGQFKPTGMLQLKWNDESVGNLSMKFLHDGRPPIVRQAEYRPADECPLTLTQSTDFSLSALNQDLLIILGSLNVASKHWIIRQYDHEVQGGSVLKPLVGVDNDGPGDAAVVRPVLSSRRGLVVACGMNPYFSDFDTYAMAASAIDEAIRNCVAVGADPDRIAILDNFSWGHTDRPSTLGSLVRAALACHDYAIQFRTPFISGKDSLHNEFSYTDEGGNRKTISIPATLLITALGQIDDVQKCVSMDFKQSGNSIYLVGVTKPELGGSHWSLVKNATGGTAPQVDAYSALRTFQALHQAIQSGLVRACHDLSEGGLAVAAAEMAFAGGLGADLKLDSLPLLASVALIPGAEVVLANEVVQLFSESNSRFLVEVESDKTEEFESAFSELACVCLGKVSQNPNLRITTSGNPVIDLPIAQLKSAWQSPLDW